MNEKILIIRFSSFGDIVQCMSTLKAMKQKYPNAKIHWITKTDFSDILSLSSDIDKIWTYEKKTKLRGLIRLAWQLRKERFNYVYDAHSNIRSRVISFILGPRLKNLILRKKERLKRFLLFYCRINLFPRPFKGMFSYISPLKKIGISTLPKSDNLFSFNKQVLEGLNRDLESKVFSNFLESDLVVALIPSAAWEMKRWPLDYWKKLIKLLPQFKFIVLGGPNDAFCQELVDVSSERVHNYAGKLSLLESCVAVTKVHSIVSADTGLLHVADLMGTKGIALIGPTAFGFTSGDLIKILEVPLKCRPCTKDGSGKCSQTVYQKCMIDITPEMVAKELRIFSNNY